VTDGKERVGDAVPVGRVNTVEVSMAVEVYKGDKGSDSTVCVAVFISSSPSGTTGREIQPGI